MMEALAQWIILLWGVGGILLAVSLVHYGTYFYGVKTVIL
jgi:hypothetical protein